MSIDNRQEVLQPRPSRPERWREGIGHRILYSLPGVFALLIALFIYAQTADLLVLAMAPSALLVVALCFAAPKILTQGWNKPFPPSSHLALWGKRTLRIVGLSASAGLLLPLVASLAIRV